MLANMSIGHRCPPVCLERLLCSLPQPSRVRPPARCALLTALVAGTDWQLRPADSSPERSLLFSLNVHTSIEMEIMQSTDRESHGAAEPFGAPPRRTAAGCDGWQ